MAASVARRLVRQSYKLVSLPSNLYNIQMQSRSISITTRLFERLYTKQHEWVTIENGKGTVGISDYAQDQTGEIVYVELPEIGTDLQKNDVAGCVESVKAVGDINCPVDGTVTEVNSVLLDNPGLVNKAPLTEGWLFKLDVAQGASTGDLMGEEAYQKFLATEGH